jgi:hypothetical protein
LAAEGERMKADRILSPEAGLVGGNEVDAIERLGVGVAVVGTQRQDGGGGAPPEFDAVILFGAVPDVG